MTTTTTMITQPPKGSPVPDAPTWVPIYFETLTCLSLVASIAVVVLFILYRKVFFRSLNVIWIAGAVGSSILHSLCLLIAGVEWIRVGSVGHQGVTFCTLRVIADGVFLTSISLFLFIYYLHIYVIKRRDEFGAMKLVKFYFLFVVLLSVALLTFLAIEVPRDYTKAGDTCVSTLSDSSRTIMFLLPLTVEVVCVLGAVVVVVRLATVSSVKAPMFVHITFLLVVIVIRLASFIGIITMDRGSTPQLVLFIIDRTLTALIGLILSLLFIFSERVPLVMKNSWSSYADADGQEGINGSQQDDASSSYTGRSGKREPSPSHLEAMGGGCASPLLEMTKANSTLEEYHKTSMSGAARNATDVPTGDFPS